MANVCDVIVIVISLVLACVSIATVAAGIAGNVWFSSTNIEIGLFKYCIDLKLSNNDKTCVTRDDIFSFNDKTAYTFQFDIENLDLDLILILAAVLALFTLPTIILLFPAIFVSKAKTRKTLALSAGILMIIAVCAGVGSVGYAEHLKSENLKNTNLDRGWSMILVWVSVGVGVITAIIALLGSCFMSDDSSNKYDDRNIPIDVRQQVNRGYDYNDDMVRNNAINVDDRFSTTGYNRPPSYNSVEQSKRSSRSDYKPELSHDKPLQTKFVYEDNKRNNRYKYTYNPEYMEQQFREQDSPQPRHQPSYANRNSIQDDGGYQPDYNRSRVRPSYDNPGYEIR